MARKPLSECAPEVQAKLRAQRRERNRRYREKLVSTPEGRAILREREARPGRKNRSGKHKGSRAAYQREWRKRNAAAYKAIVARYYAKRRLINPPKPRRCKVPVAPFYDARFDDQLYARIYALTPRYAADVRDDIISDVYLGVLEGTYPLEVTADHVKHAARMVLRQVAPHDTVSLDSVIGNDGFTRGQALGVY